MVLGQDKGTEFHEGPVTCLDMGADTKILLSGNETLIQTMIRVRVTIRVTYDYVIRRSLSTNRPGPNAVMWRQKGAARS